MYLSDLNFRFFLKNRESLFFSSFSALFRHLNLMTLDKSIIFCARFLMLVCLLDESSQITGKMCFFVTVILLD